MHNPLASSSGEAQKTWLLMDKILASAPGRVFLAGEAAFEYGAKALSLPVEAAGKRNSVTFSFQETPGKIVAYSGQTIASLMPNGRVKGDGGLRQYLGAAKAGLVAAGIDLETMDTSFSMSLEPALPESLGLSASLCSAIFSGVFSYYAEKEGARDAFSKAYSTAGADSIMDADVCLMASDSALVLTRSFLLDGTVKLASKKARAAMPDGTTLLYAEPAGTKDLREEMSRKISAFSKAACVSGNRAKTALQMTSGERANASEAFSSITTRLAKELAAESPSAEKTAIYLECEQELLSASGAVPASCAAAVTAAKKAGALAAKSSGFFGGVIAFCYENGADAVADGLAASSFSVCGPLVISKKGADCAPA